MGAIKIEKFLGIAPRIASENLPEHAAQIAKNCKIYSGDLIPYKEAALETSLTKAGVIKSIYPMDTGTYDADGVSIKRWLHWTDDVDVVRTMTDGASGQRIYYTGDTTAVSGPKVTDYTLATSATDYPKNWYILGLPVPIGACVATANFPYTASAITYATGYATVTHTAHGRSTGDIIYMSGANQTEYNISTAIIRVDADHFKYAVAGTPAAGTGTFKYAVGNTVAKAKYYVYTWATDWGWESKPSPVSNIVTAMDGQQVDLSSLPVTAGIPANYGNITKIRIYRTVTGSSGTAYYQVDEKTINATSTYADTKVESQLVNALTTQQYDPPLSDLKGLVSMPNGILAGFSGNYVYFSEPYKPWAWPLMYRKAMDFTVIGLAATGTTLVVCTDSKPAYITGNTSSSMSVSRPDLHYPCVSKRSIVNMGWGILYASYDGLVQVSAGLGNKLATKLISYRDEWLKLKPSEIVASQHADKYVATHPTGGFTFERDDQTGGNLTTLDTRFTGAYFHSSESTLYYVDYLNTNPSKVYKFDNQSSLDMAIDWMSKTIVLPRALNLGAVMVQADYTGYSQPAIDAALAAYNAESTTANADGELNAAVVNMYDLNGDGGGTLPVIEGVVLFQWYVDKQLIYQTYITDSKPVALPTGYRSTTYECRVQSKIRIRYIEIGETPLDLETV